MKGRKLLFPIFGAVYTSLFAIELNPTFYKFVHYFIPPTDDTLLIRASLVWGLCALILGVIYVLFKGNWRQLLFVVIVYFLVYYIEGIVWFEAEKDLYESGNYSQAQMSRTYSVAHFSNFFEYDRNHVSGSNFFYFSYKSLCFALFFTIPTALRRVQRYIQRKFRAESQIIDD
ncbi:MAG: hypothetical protein ACFHU9_03245 [Fluviicola sp.]